MKKPIIALTLAISSIFSGLAYASPEYDRRDYIACTKDGKTASINLIIGSTPKDGLEHARETIQKMWEAVVNPLTAQELNDPKIGFTSLVDHIYTTEDEIDANILKSDALAPDSGQTCTLKI